MVPIIDDITIFSNSFILIHLIIISFAKNVCIDACDTSAISVAIAAHINPYLGSKNKLSKKSTTAPVVTAHIKYLSCPLGNNI